MIERQGAYSEAELLTAAARFSWQFQTAVHGHIKDEEGLAAVIPTEDESALLFKQEFTLRAGIPHTVQLTHSVWPVQEEDPKRLLVEISIVDLHGIQGEKPFVAFKGFADGHFSISGSPSSDGGISISSRQLTNLTQLTENLANTHLRRAFLHFGIPPQILTGAPTT